MAAANDLILGIDAANIRGGGGLTHLKEILSAGEPTASGISKIIVWSGPGTIDLLPRREWLELESVSGVEGSLIKRVNWQRRHLDERLATGACGALLIPGGSYLGRFKPFVAICQNLLPFCPMERARFGMSWARVRYHLLERIQSRTFRSADGVIFLTNSARQIVWRQLGRCSVKSRIISHGIHERFRSKPRPQKPLSAYSPERPFRWLYVSIINWYKHQETVAAAAARLRQSGWPLAVDFVGPSYPPALRRLKRALEHLDPDSRFLRHHQAASGVELESWYRGADGFIFASSCENMPNILVEAMAAGLPIACSRVPPMPEILGEAGGYFAPENEAELANLLLRFMREPEWRASCARRAFGQSRKYSWQKCARETFDYVFRVCAPGV